MPKSPGSVSEESIMRRLMLPCVYLNFFSVVFLTIVGMSLMSCKFDPVDVPSHLLRGNSSNSGNEFNVMLSDIYYQHLDRYLSDSSRIMYVVPEISVTYNSVTLIYHHGISKGPGKLEDIDGAIFQAVRGSQYSGSSSLGQLKKSQESNAKVRSLMADGVDIFQDDKPKSSTLVGKLLTAKGFRLFFIVSWCVSVASILYEPFSNDIKGRYAPAVSLFATLIMILAAMINDIAIHVVASSPYLALRLGCYLPSLIITSTIMALYMIDIYFEMKEMAALKADVVEGSPQDSEGGMSPAVSILANDKIAPQLNMISSSSSGSARQKGQGVDSRPRGFAFSNSGSFNQGLGAVAESGNEPHEAAQPVLRTSSSKYSNSAIAESLDNNSPLIKYKSLTSDRSPAQLARPWQTC